MQAICLYLRKGQTVFSIYLFDLFSDLRIDAETEHIRLGRCHNVSTSDSSSLDCFLGHSISDDIKKPSEM